MAEKGYSEFGLDPHRLRDVLRPLVEQVGSMEGSQFRDQRQRFLYFQVVDAYESGEALLLITDAGLRGEPIGMGAVEVIVRRLIEQAIIARVVHAASDDSIITSYLMTNAHEWERSWGTKLPFADPTVTKLDNYKDMAESIDPELYQVYRQLSYLSHPRSAFPYSARSRDTSIGPIRYFELNLAKAAGWTDIAVRHLLFPYRGDPGPSSY